MISTYKVNLFSIFLLLIFFLIIFKRKRKPESFFIILIIFLFLYQFFLYLYLNGVNPDDINIFVKLLTILMLITLSVYLIKKYKAYVVVPFMIIFIILNIYVLVNDISIYYLGLVHLIICSVILQCYNKNNIIINILCLLLYFSLFIISNSYKFFNSFSIMSVVFSFFVCIL